MAIFNLFNRKRKGVPKDYKNRQSQLAEEMAELFNGTYDGKLDFSTSSLAILDEILDICSNNQDDIEVFEKRKIVEQSGAYLFEVIRRNFGGTYHWSDVLSQPILVTDKTSAKVSLLAYKKVEDRIEKGIHESILFYFKGYLERLNTVKRGDKILIT